MFVRIEKNKDVNAMRRYLLPSEGTFYKANLHSHSTVSDGNLTPEEMKRAYMERGYSIIAFTDHEILIDHSDLNEETFLAITGYELSVNERGDKPWPQKKTCHLNLYARDPHNTTQVCFHPEQFWFCGEEVYGKIRYVGDHYIREHTPDCINDIIRTARENGFLVAYNHPHWSREDPGDYLNYEGLFAMEIYNHGSNSVGFFEYDIQDYDLMLRSGKRLFCSATDDNHNKNPRGIYTDSFGGFDMIKVPSLTYDAVIRALEHGDFYASQGPEIHDLYLEDGTVHVKCSPAKYISYVAGVRRNAARFGYEGYLEEAAFTVDPDDVCFRISVVDEQGRHADTHAYFLDELRT